MAENLLGITLTIQPDPSSTLKDSLGVRDSLPGQKGHWKGSSSTISFITWGLLLLTEAIMHLSPVRGSSLIKKLMAIFYNSEISQ